MMTIGGIAFLSPWILAGLLALPVLWWLLRAIPPSPKTQVFAGVRLLLGLEDDERQADKTPWWLLLLRCLAIAAALIGFAQPVLNLESRLAGNGNLLLVMDQGWASAPDWSQRVATARTVLDEAGQNNRRVVLVGLADGEVTPPVSAYAALPLLDALEPRPWEPDTSVLQEWIEGNPAEIRETVWVHDGLGRSTHDELLADLSGLGPLRLIGPQAAAAAVTPPYLDAGVLKTDVLRARSGPESVEIVAIGRADEGGERRIAVASAEFDENATRATASFNLPSELYGSVTRISLTQSPSAGASAFADSAIRRVKAGLVATNATNSVSNLTSPTHYLEKAVVPWADLQPGSLQELIDDNPAAIILVDQGDFTESERTSLTDWVENGGLLVRFAGPRLAASIGEPGLGGSLGNDPLLPVRLRRGGRVLGGALAWTTPRALGPFDPSGPFVGLIPPTEVDVRTQVLAEPSPDLAGKVWASLDDGTPLVTAKRSGDGRIVLFHVSSDAEWSSLPLSGLFVEMLGRIMALAPGRGGQSLDPEALAGTLWRADLLMGSDGQPVTASELSEAVPGERLAEGGVSSDLPPGIYFRADGGNRDTNADAAVVNLMTRDAELSSFPDAPAGTVIETLGVTQPERIGPVLLVIALILAMVDVIATLFVSGRLGSRPVRSGLAALALVVFAAGLPESSLAQETQTPREAISSTAETTLGYVVTGAREIDRKSERGVFGLGSALTRLTAIEPGPPVGVRPGKDEMSFYPVIYWPLREDTIPDREGLDALAEYIRTGGMLIIDTQNGASGFGGASAGQMRRIARALNLPPLAPVGKDHVLTRTFYLLNDFPGRWRGERIWTEAPPPSQGSGEQAEDIPQFDRVDDNVSPVIVGSADWAAAWAVDDSGLPMYPIGRPGDRQREMAIRFGINAVMYALTGNYKSDQVHAPAVLQRLGQ
ncbi:MAG: DUF4159 domain-containing protein [Pseudomonadota bacterium]